MIIVKEGQTLSEAIRESCAKAHDFSHGSHRCWNCNIRWVEVTYPADLVAYSAQPEDAYSAFEDHAKEQDPTGWSAVHTAQADAWMLEWETRRNEAHLDRERGN